MLSYKSLIFLKACPNNLAPTTSTTCQLVLGDALVVTVMVLRGFTAENFKQFHPGGNLGTLLIPVKNFMYKDDRIPLIGLGASIKEAIIEMNSKARMCWYCQSSKSVCRDFYRWRSSSKFRSSSLLRRTC